MLIGAELKELIDGHIPVAVVAGKTILGYYVSALQKIGIPLVDQVDVSEATVAGHRKIYELYKDDVRNSKF